MLYDFYAKIEGPLAKELLFISRAIGSDETRYFMTYFVVERKQEDDPSQGLRAIATDGRRLHIVEPLCKTAEAYGISPGKYHVVGKTKKSIQIARISDASSKDAGDFPNWRRVIPDSEPIKVFDVSLESNRRSLLQTSAAVFSIARNLPPEAFINLDYLDDIIADSGLVWTCEAREGLRPVVFSSGSYKAVIAVADANDY